MPVGVVGISLDNLPIERVAKIKSLSLHNVFFFGGVGNLLSLRIQTPP